MKKKILSIVLLTVVMCLVKAVDLQAQEEFKGHRSTRCIISQSDLENFVMGGKSTLEMILAQNQSKSYTVYTKSLGMDLELCIEYSFESYEDYDEKTRKLLGYKPITTYGESKVPYVENFSPLELFNFIDVAMQKSGVVEETNFCRLLSVKKDVVELNGGTYESTEALNTAKEDEIVFTNIDIDTELTEGIYTRKIGFSMEETEAREKVRVLRDRCGVIGVELNEEGERNCSVTVTSDSEKQLIKDTMMILGTAVNIEHKKYYNTDTSVRMKTVERIDTENILSEKGKLSYHINLPETYTNLSADIEPQKGEEENDGSDTSVSGSVVRYSGREGEIDYYYDTPLAFDNISVITDLSSEGHKINRTITFYMDWNIADDYYKATKKQMEKGLKRGETLRIYDDEGYRCYEITYSSWFTSKIDSFTNRVFGINNGKLTLKRSTFPFVKSKIRDKFNIGKGDIKDYSESVSIKYILPNNTKIEEGVYEGKEGKNVSLISPFDVSTEIEFSAFHYTKFILYILAIIITGVAIFLFVGNVQRKIVKFKRGKGRGKRKNGQQHYPRYCPKCGSERKNGATFCGKCGYRY